MTNTFKKASKTASSKSKSSNAGASVTKPILASEPQATAPAAPKTPSKQQQLAALVLRDEGATLDQMIAATSWLPHTTRAALTGLKKKGYALSSDKVGGVRTYRAVAP